MAVRVLSGTRPTGKLHVGHLLGALENYKALEGNESFFMIADWHALTTEYEAKTTIAQNSLEIIIDYLASGLDPAHCSIFIQSEVHEHAEMALLLSMITPLGWLERNPTYKDQLRELKGKDLHTHGFLGYPVLQAADIILYKANKVPVGEDQKPHIELTREIVRRFHFLYQCEIFPEPEAVLTQVPKVPGLDGRKMSKSYQNCIYLADSAEEVAKKTATMFTDPARKKRTDRGHPEVCPVYTYHQIVNREAAPVVALECRTAARGCVECKKEMTAKLNAFLEPVRERRAVWCAKPAAVREVLDTGKRKAQAVAKATLAEAMHAVGMKS
ncbi:MAG: tryptophan--tRNA ligase [Candidatus Omnitrophota bacterium]